MLSYIVAIDAFQLNGRSPIICFAFHHEDLAFRNIVPIQSGTGKKHAGTVFSEAWIAGVKTFAIDFIGQRFSGIPASFIALFWFG